MSERALRRINIHKLMDLKIDYAFKQFFGSEKNKELTVVFLNAILQRTGHDTVKEITFINKEYDGQYVDDKQSRLDIVVRTQDGNLINIEVQISNDNSMMKRTLFYWARLYNSQLQRGKGYHTLLPTITINICDFTLFNNPYYHSTYHLYEDSTMERLPQENDVLEIHFIEMRKFILLWYEKKLNAFDDILVRWLLLLGMVDARKQKVYEDIFKELEELAMKDERLLKAFSAWEELSQTPESKIAYESRLKAIIDEEAKLDYARFKGREEGKEIGLEEGLKKGQKEAKREIILNGAKNGLDIPTLAKITGYSEEQVKEILKENS